MCWERLENAYLREKILKLIQKYLRKIENLLLSAIGQGLVKNVGDECIGLDIFYDYSVNDLRFLPNVFFTVFCAVADFALNKTDGM